VARVLSPAEKIKVLEEELTQEIDMRIHTNDLPNAEFKHTANPAAQAGRVRDRRLDPVCVRG